MICEADVEGLHARSDLDLMAENVWRNMLKNTPELQNTRRAEGMRPRITEHARKVFASLLDGASKDHFLCEVKVKSIQEQGDQVIVYLDLKSNSRFKDFNTFIFTKRDDGGYYLTRIRNLKLEN